MEDQQSVTSRYLPSMTLGIKIISLKYQSTGIDKVHFEKQSYDIYRSTMIQQNVFLYLFK